MKDYDVVLPRLLSPSTFVSGFFFLPSAITPEQQARLMIDAITKYTEPPNRTNFNAQYGPIHGLWRAYEMDGVLRQCDHVEEGMCQPMCLEEQSALQVEGQELAYGSADQAIQDEQPTVSSPMPQPDKGADRGNELLEFCCFAVPGDQPQHRDSVRPPLPATKLLKKLRWATLGEQFDWTNRAYDPALPHAPFPPFLASLSQRLARPALDSALAFSPEAAIINFYHEGDTLGGHIDDMEEDWSKPIVSISLGCDAIFLLGGETREEVPSAVFLRSGDVVLMSGECRRCYHGVPRIFTERSPTCVYSRSDVLIAEHCQHEICRFLRNVRININVRQVH